MQTLKTEQAMFLLQSIALPALKNEHRTTKKIIEAVPLDKGHYRPDPVSRTALELAWHIAAAENRFLETTINGEFNTSASARPESVLNSADVAAWYAERFEKNLDGLKQLRSEHL